MKGKNIYLLIDTTQKGLIFALAEEKKLIYSFSEDLTLNRYHSTLLIPKINEVLNKHNLTVEEIKTVAVNCGPGSFTGIRIGLTFVRMLGQFISTSLYGFNTFELIAGHEKFRTKSITVLLNAYRNRHYRATIKVDKMGDINWIESPYVIDNHNNKPINAEKCLIEKSIQDKITINYASPELIEEDFMFTPDVMLFYIQAKQSERLFYWYDLQPLYLQLPQITNSIK